MLGIGDQIAHCGGQEEGRHGGGSDEVNGGCNGVIIINILTAAHYQRAVKALCFGPLRALLSRL